MLRICRLSSNRQPAAPLLIQRGVYYVRNRWCFVQSTHTNCTRSLHTNNVRKALSQDLARTLDFGGCELPCEHIALTRWFKPRWQRSAQRT